MEMLTNAIAWFEIPVDNFDRAKKFYSAVFDFEMPEMEMGPNRMGILLYDQAGGGVGGAIVKGKEGYTPAKTGAKIYLNGGADLAVVLARVEKAGGRITLPKMLIAPDVGYMAFFEDTEGNEIGLHSMQ
jgi:predicted enzyme related to lactoylglutathione lyase